jgi:hypothetical protein
MINMLFNCAGRGKIRLQYILRYIYDKVCWKFNFSVGIECIQHISYSQPPADPGGAIRPWPPLRFSVGFGPLPGIQN